MKRTLLISVLLCGKIVFAQSGSSFQEEIKNTLRKPAITKAEWAMQQEPVTVTATIANRSAGGKHDFYSEGDYWWPNPKHPDSPYIQKDGMTNPDNFTAHRYAMIRLSEIVGSLTTAFILTGKQAYADKALQHCKAWFVDTATRMNPHLLYAQAIKGRYTGRGIGIIDAVHLMEVVRGLTQIEKLQPQKNKLLIDNIRNWFSTFETWLTTHQYGKDEMNAANNHGTCWVMQVAVFAKFTGDESLLEFCSDRYKKVLLPNQMAVDGSFPLELRRTKPYGYSIFNLDAMATICQVLSKPGDDLWNYTTSDGKSMYKAITYLYPFISAKNTWPFSKDVMYWDNWPVAQPFLLFGATAFNERSWFNTWQKLDHVPVVEEVIRNLPVRNPLLWY
jgi:hypothetical protein